MCVSLCLSVCMCEWGMRQVLPGCCEVALESAQHHHLSSCSSSSDVMISLSVHMYAYRWYALFWSHALALSHSLRSRAAALSSRSHRYTHTHTHTMKSAWFANTWSRYVYLFNFKRANRAFATSRLILISNLISEIYLKQTKYKLNTCKQT